MVIAKVYRCGTKPMTSAPDASVTNARGRSSNLRNQLSVRRNENIAVLSRPMPGINFEFFIGITPKFGKNKKKSENTNM